MDELLKILASALIAYLVPKLLDPLFERRRARSGPAEPEDASVEPGPKASPPRRVRWLAWCLAMAIAGAVGGILSALIGLMRLETHGGMANWATYGACLGIAQWLVLQRNGKLTPWWAVACALGWGVCAPFQAEGDLVPFGAPVAGLVIGVLQWPMLRSRRRRAWLWIPANGLALLIAGPVGMSLLAVEWVTAWTAVALICALVLGPALAMMPLRRG